MAEPFGKISPFKAESLMKRPKLLLKALRKTNLKPRPKFKAIKSASRAKTKMNFNL